MLIKIDMSAYDRIIWDFLRFILGSFGFDPSQIHWILNLTSSAFFSILVNGSPSPTFKASRGLRQGDPLSPYLFIILVEGSGQFMKQNMREGHLKGLVISPQTNPLSYLQFVDDALLLGKPTVQEARAIKKTLDVFLSTSGMKLKIDKSIILFFNTPNIIQQRITKILGFQRSSLPSRYLRDPLLDKAPRNPMLSKLENRLNSWTHRFLSLSGIILLIKLVLMVMLVYLFSVLATTVHIYQKIRSIQRNFLQEGTKRGKKWALIAWEKLCEPKSRGGLGLKDPQRLGQALATKIYQ